MQKGMQNFARLQAGTYRRRLQRTAQKEYKRYQGSREKGMKENLRGTRLNLSQKGSNDIGKGYKFQSTMIKLRKNSEKSKPENEKEIWQERAQEK